MQASITACRSPEVTWTISTARSCWYFCWYANPTYLKICFISATYIELSIPVGGTRAAPLFYLSNRFRPPSGRLRRTSADAPDTASVPLDDDAISAGSSGTACIARLLVQSIISSYLTTTPGSSNASSRGHRSRNQDKSRSAAQRMRKAARRRLSVRAQRFFGQVGGGDDLDAGCARRKTEAASRKGLSNNRPDQPRRRATSNAPRPAASSNTCAGSGTALMV